jgi:hypothetical protein
MNSKVAILGKLVSKYNAPFEDMSYDIWTCNYNDPLPRIDHIFDIHAHGANPKATITRANYPFKEAEMLVSGNYYNNTLSYMISLSVAKLTFTIKLLFMSILILTYSIFTKSVKKYKNQVFKNYINCY